MAVRTYAVGDSETVKLWSKRLAREALKQTVIFPYIRDDGNALCEMKTDTQKSAGDRVSFTLRMQLKGDGVGENETQEGNEEAISTYVDNITLGELSHAFRGKTKITQQRVPFDLGREGNDALSDWWADRIDTVAFNQLCGYSIQTNPKYTGFNAITAPTTGRYLSALAAGTTDEALTSGNIFTLQMIDQAKEVAETGGSAGLVPIRPIKGLPMGAKYVCFVHPTQVTSLRTNSTSNGWLDLQKAQLQGGKGDDSMLFKGGLGVWNEVLLVSANRVTDGVNSTNSASISTVRRAVFCGSQALVTAYGKGYGPEQWDVQEETFDYGRQYGANGLNIFAFKKAVFNNNSGSASDFATIVLPSYAANAA
jgi:N4-gp56 family major capsid protein